jgi:hypothetical protein
MSEPLDPKLDRRSLLQRGALAGAGAALLPQVSRASSAASGAATAPANCNEVISDTLDPVDEDCELALDYMWCQFARQAQATGAKDIEWRAVRYARSGIRLLVRTNVEQQGLDTFIETIFPASFAANWDRLAAQAGKGGGVISDARMRSAWNAVYGTSHDPDKIPDLRPIVERAVEVIGSQMWFQYTLGVIANGDKPFDVTVLKAGREHSRHYLRKNVNRQCIVDAGAGGVDSDGRSCIDYSKWEWIAVTPCCLKAGKDSWTYADQVNNPDIGYDHFHAAWCDGNTFMKKLNARLARQGKEEIKTSGCG